MSKLRSPPCQRPRFDFFESRSRPQVRPARIVVDKMPCGVSTVMDCKRPSAFSPGTTSAPPLGVSDSTRKPLPQQTVQA